MSKNRIDDLTGLFEQVVSRESRFALGMAYSVGGAQPEIFTTGPLYKGSDRQVGQGAPWHIGSITKTFTATLILKRVEGDQLQLDAPIGDYLSDHAPEMHADWRNRTLRQLLGHRAGLPANPPRRMRWDTPPEDQVEDRVVVLSQMWDNPLGRNAGTFCYSNIGFVLTAAVAESASGRAWSDLICDEIAEPLGLASLGFGAPDADGAPWGHRRLFGFYRPVDPRGRLRVDNPVWMGPAGRIHMNLKDLIVWGQAHLDARRGAMPKFLNGESALLMQTATTGEYGLGWAVQTFPGSDVQIVWHNGSNTLWYTFLALVPAHDIVLAVTRNIADAPLVDRLARETLGVLIEEGAGVGRS